jgi:peptidyl-prolyl cis-trans isomerase D
MESFRASTKYVFWLLLFSFGVLFMLADTQVFDAISAGPRSMGTVNGEPITFEAYNNRITFYSERYREQTGDSPTAELRSYYEQTAWNDLVTAEVVKQKMDELGIMVTDDEVRDMILGDNPDPFIRQQFTDSTGNFNRDALLNAVEAKENAPIWLQVETQLREQRRQQKLSTFLESGVLIGAKEVEQAYVRQNSTADIVYVRFPLSEIADSAVTASDAELKSWFKKNENRFKQKKSWRFSYVTFDTTPTAEDTALAVNELNELRERFATAKNDSVFMRQNQSETNYTSAFIAKADVKPAFSPLFTLKAGEVSEALVADGQVHILKLIEVKGSGDKAEYRFADFSRTVKADPFGSLGKTQEQADDFVYFARESGFAAQAQQMGLTVQNGFISEGNPFIAGLGQSRLVLSFMERTKKAGRISEPLELPNKLVIVQVDEIIEEGVRAFDEVKAQVERSVKNEKRKKLVADNVASIMASAKTVEEVAAASGKAAQNGNTIRLDAGVIPGAGREPGLIGKVFTLEPGSDTQVFTGENAVFVFRVTAKNMADAATLTAAQREELKNQLKQQLNGMFSRTWVEQLIAEAEVEDFRALMLQD